LAWPLAMETTSAAANSKTNMRRDDRLTDPESCPGEGPGLWWYRAGEKGVMTGDAEMVERARRSVNAG